MKKAIGLLFLLLFLAASFLLYLKLSTEPTLAESIENGRSAFASQANLSFVIKERLTEKDGQKQTLLITIKGRGQERDYRLKGEARFMKKRSFFMKREDSEIRILPAQVSPLLPSWIKNWSSNSRLLLAQLVFSPAAQEASAREKRLAEEEVLFYPLRENFLKTLIPDSGFLKFKRGAIAFSRENSLPLYLSALYQSSREKEISGIQAITKKITVYLNWQEGWKR